MNGEVNRDRVIDWVKQQRRVVTAQISELQALLDHLKGIEDYYSKSFKQIPLSIEPMPKTNEYKKLSLSEAILKILDDRPDKEWNPPEIAIELQRGGIQTNAKNFKGTVAATLMRLAGEEKLERIREPNLKRSKYKKKVAP